MRLSKPVLSSTNNNASLNKEPVVTNTSTATYSTEFIRGCPFKCAHVPKTFTHKDEFQIHIDFYHDGKIAPSQWLTDSHNLSHITQTHATPDKILNMKIRLKFCRLLDNKIFLVGILPRYDWKAELNAAKNINQQTRVRKFMEVSAFVKSQNLRWTQDTRLWSISHTRSFQVKTPTLMQHLHI